MGQEIEYKFLVDTEQWNRIVKPEPLLIIQSYLQKEKERTVRIRVKGNKGYLTIKGATKGVTRAEYEYEVPLNDVEEMISTFKLPHIRKRRYEVQVDQHLWEVDVFEGALAGLILAEVEVQEEGVSFTKPDWVTEDVSLNPKYYNAVLIEKC
ncbi:MAG: CYTH domain-containing protein [Fluviicola sp.]